MNTKKTKYRILSLIIIIVLLSIAFDKWDVWRMTTNQDSNYKPCAVFHNHVFNGVERQEFPTAEEIIEQVNVFRRNDDVEGFHSYVMDLYRGNGTNYVPIIALSGWHDRSFFAEFESANFKYSRLENYFKQNYLNLNENEKMFYLNSFDSQIGYLKRDFYKDGTPSVRFIKLGGYRTSVRNSSLHFDWNHFEELENFLRDAPPIFINKDENVNLIVQIDTQKNRLPNRNIFEKIFFLFVSMIFFVLLFHEFFIYLIILFILRWLFLYFWKKLKNKSKNN